MSGPMRFGLDPSFGTKTVARKKGIAATAIVLLVLISQSSCFSFMASRCCYGQVNPLVVRNSVIPEPSSDEGPGVGDDGEKKRLHETGSSQNPLKYSGVESIAEASEVDKDDVAFFSKIRSGRGCEKQRMGKDGGGLGEYNPAKRLPGRKEEVLVGDPPIKKEKEYSVTSILKELEAIQEQGPQKYCVLGTRHCSYLHQRIIELLAYALVLSGNHVFTSGAGGTHAATIRGALRAERPDLLTVVLPQSLLKQPKESQALLKDVTDIIEMPQNDEMSLDVASRICNSYMLNLTDHLVSFAFHESKTVIEASREARALDMLVTTLFLD